MIDNLKYDENAWAWELTKVNNSWRYLINKDVDIINVGRTNDLNWGIVRGKITDEFKKFLVSENIYSDEIEVVFK